MKQIEAGLWDGDMVRAERLGKGWRAQARLRDCGAPLGVMTGLYEHHPEGPWTDIGTYRALRVVERAGEALKTGAKFFIGPHSNETGMVPGRLVDFAEVKLRLMDLTQPGWREDTHENGQPKWAKDGTLLDADGNRSIFDDVDE